MMVRVPNHLIRFLAKNIKLFLSSKNRKLYGTRQKKSFGAFSALKQFFEQRVSIQIMANLCARRIRIQIYQYSTQAKLLSPPQLKVDLLCCYLNQTCFAKFYPRISFHIKFFSPFRAVWLVCLYFIDQYSILLLISCKNNTQGKVH